MEQSILPESLLIATIAAGLFAGAAIYISIVEHPARIEAGTAVAVAEFGPSYRRAATMQASLALLGSLTGVVSWLEGAGLLSLAAAIALFSVVPFTLVVIYPTNKQLLSRELDPSGSEAQRLLVRWGRLHWVRSVLGLLAFILLLQAPGR
jgi:hypothetical protein